MSYKNDPQKCRFCNDSLHDIGKPGSAEDYDELEDGEWFLGNNESYEHDGCCKACGADLDRVID